MINLTEFKIQKLSEVESVENFYEILILEIFQELKNLDKKYGITETDNYYSLLETDLKALWARKKREQKLRDQHIAKYGSSKLPGINNLKDKIFGSVNAWIDELKRIISIEIANVKAKAKPEPVSGNLPKYNYDYRPPPSYYDYYPPPAPKSSQKPTFGGRLVGGLKGLWKGLKGESFENTEDLLSEITDDLAKVLDKINYWIEKFRKSVLNFIDAKFADFNSDYENKEGDFWEPKTTPIDVFGPSSTSSSTVVGPSPSFATGEKPKKSSSVSFEPEVAKKIVDIIEKDDKIDSEIKQIVKDYIQDDQNDKKYNAVTELFQNKIKGHDFIQGLWQYSHIHDEAALKKDLEILRKMSKAAIDDPVKKTRVDAIRNRDMSGIKPSEDPADLHDQPEEPATEEPATEEKGLFAKQNPEEKVNLIEKDDKISDKMKDLFKDYINFSIKLNQKPIDKINIEIIENKIKKLLKNEDEAQEFIDNFNKGTLNLNDFLEMARKLSKPKSGTVIKPPEDKPPEDKSAEIKTPGTVMAQDLGKSIKPKQTAKAKDDVEAEDDENSVLNIFGQDDEEKEDIERHSNESDDDFETRLMDLGLSDIDNSVPAQISKPSQKSQKSQEPQEVKPKRGRGRPRGSRNKKN